MTRAYRCIFWHATHSFLLLTPAPHTFRGWTLPTYSVLRHSTVKLNSYNLDCCVLSPNSPFCGLLRTVSTYTFGVCTTSDVWLPQRISYLNKRLSQDTPPSQPRVTLSFVKVSTNQLWAVFSKCYPASCIPCQFPVLSPLSGVYICMVPPPAPFVL